jgi:UbiA prenyltransferase family
MAAIFYALGVAAGLAIVAFREPSVLWLGLGGVFLAYFYHAPPFQLSYRGFGELAVAFAYGPLITCGTYLVQRRAISPEVALLSLPLGLLIAAFLWINEFPDCKAERRRRQAHGRGASRPKARVPRLRPAGVACIRHPGGAAHRRRAAPGLARLRRDSARSGRWLAPFAPSRDHAGHCPGSGMDAVVVCTDGAGRGCGPPARGKVKSHPDPRTTLSKRVREI